MADGPGGRRVISPGRQLGPGLNRGVLAFSYQQSAISKNKKSDESDVQ
jgi:hypothetical protein